MQEEGKTIFEHINTMKGKNQLPNWLMNIIKMVMIGFIAGLVLDILLEYNKLAIVLPLVMLLIAILKIKNKEKEEKD